MDDAAMHDTSISDLDQTITYQVYRAGRLLRHFLHQKLRIDEVQLTPEQFFILLRLYEKDGQTQRELADKILNDHPNITRLIDKLEKSAYVRRKNDAKDRRNFLITLSAKGKALCETRVPLIQQERKRLFKGLTKEEIKMFQSVLHRIETNIMA
ncbi:MAG: MarR family transcriptional regulator [Smithella sp.]|jgi:DNA-binding MarR family transcriptional regulator